MSFKCVCGYKRGIKFLDESSTENVLMNMDKEKRFDGLIEKHEKECTQFYEWEIVFNKMSKKGN